jgi:selenoprotein W-related protein
MPRAASLAAEIERRFGITPQLIKSRGGVFEISVGDELIFSKKQSGRFPEPGEVERELGARAGA